MKIVLRQDVPKLGETGSIQTVKNGYARNFLIPRGMAVVASESEVKIATHNLAVKERKTGRQEEQLRSYSDKIQGQRLVFTAKSGEHGRLYGSITVADIAKELSAKIGEDVDRRRIQLDDPLRTIGEHTVTIHVVGRLRPQVTVVVETERDEEAAPARAEESTSTGEETSEPLVES